MAKHPGLAITRSCHYPRSVGSGGSLMGAMTTEKLSQSRNCSNQVGRKQGNKYSGLLFPPNCWLFQSEARGQESSDDVVPREQGVETGSGSQRRLPSTRA